MNLLLGRSELDIARAVLLALHRNGIGQLQDVPEKESPSAITWKCPIGNAAVYYDQARSGMLYLPIEYGPDFGFEDHNHRRPDSAEHAPHCKSIVDGRIENGSRKPRQPLFRNEPSGHGSYRHP